MNNGQYTGLTDAEVLAARTASGKNVLKKHGRSSVAIIIDVIADPMFILLLIACSIYFITGRHREGLIMIVAIIAVAGISVFQAMRSERAVKALRKLTQPLATVIRNGSKVAIPSEDLVPGDIMVISEGEQLSADAVILGYNDLSVNEAILTGESFPVEKNLEHNELFSGTTVSSGLAYARVTATGNNTRIGRLGIAMEQTAKERTPLQKQVRLFVKQMAIFGFLAFAFVCLYNAVKSGDWLFGLMQGLTLAMAVIPEEIPVALSTFMALGAYRMMRVHVLVKQPQTVEALGAATVICLDKTGTITENKMQLQEMYDVIAGNTVAPLTATDSARQLLLITRLASEPVPFDPMEKAICKAFDDAGISNAGYTMIKEYPLSGKPPLMTHIYVNESGKRVIACKGAPEGIINNALLSAEEKKRIAEVQAAMAAKGNRILAVATTDYKEDELPAEQTAFRWKLLGLVALSDPPKQNMVSVIKGFYSAGIEVKMITGDYPQTACGIAKQVGMREPGRYMIGEEISKLNEKELSEAVERVNIFARVMPEAKLRIINALKLKGEVVAMTGDGVNDGPALKAAHIGIAMGSRGSEVARQAASLVLVNEDLNSMVNAVALGRKIYSNLKKAIQYIITIHIPILAFVIIPLLLGWKYTNLFSPVHIIFLELIMGPTCSIVYENEPMEGTLMNRKPRKFSTSFFSWGELSLSLLQGAIVGIGLLFMLYLSIARSLDINATRTVAFVTIIFSNVLLTLVGRSKHYAIFTTIRYHNRLVPVIVFATLALLAVTVYYPPVQSLFGFTVIPHQYFILSLLVSAVSVLWIEIYKALRAK